MKEKIREILENSFYRHYKYLCSMLIKQPYANEICDRNINQAINEILTLVEKENKLLATKWRAEILLEKI